MKSPVSASIIQMTRIHAIQWYGFCDSFDLAGQTVITGVYGCGKTGLVDLIQTVLLGPPERESRYNLALAGVGSDGGKTAKRDLRGYCLQDLNLVEQGHPIYARQSSRTYIALEFTWPDGRRETWGTRVEYKSTGADPEFLYWKVPGRVEYTDFLDSEKIPLSAEDWERFLARHKERPLPSRESYLEALSAAQHLNFNRKIFKPLLLQTLRFSFGRDFTEFCRNHILAEDTIDLAEVRASFDYYKRLVERMRIMQDQEIILAQIGDLFTKQLKLAEEENAFLWFRQHYLVEDAKKELTRKEGEWAKLKAEAEVWQAKEAELQTAKETAEQRLNDITRELRQNPQSIDFETLRKRQKALPREIEDLKEVLADPVADLRHKHRRILALWEDAQQSTRKYEWKAATTSLPAQLPANLGANQLGQQVSELVSAIDPLAAHFDRIARPLEQQRESLNGRVVSLRKDLARLRDRKSAENLPLHEALLAKLGPTRVQLVGSLCEVEDLDWTDALEVNFGHKFASLVSDNDLKDGFSVLFQLTQVNGRERLICPRDLRAMHGTVRPGSLAEKISSKNADVRRLLAHLFGDVKCCVSIDEAEQAPRAVLLNGTLKEPGGRRRLRATPSEYLIGETGRKRMIQIREDEINRVQVQLDQMTEQAAAARNAADGFQNTKEALLALSLGKVAPLRQLEDKLREQNEVHESLARIAGRDNLEKEFQRKLRASENADKAASDLRDHGATKPAGLAELEVTVKGLRDSLGKQEKALLKWQMDHPEEFDAASRNSTLRTEIEAEINSHKSGSAAAEILGNRRKVEKVQLQSDLRDKRKTLKLDTRSTDYRDLDEVDFQDNTLCDKKLAFIRESGIRDLAKDADKAEGEWEYRFQQQVLGRLAQHLDEIKRTFDALRRIIAGKEIGGATYEFTYKAIDRTDFARLRDLSEEAETDALFAPDDPALIARKEKRRAAMESLNAKADDPKSAEKVANLLDARQYFTYDMLIQESGRSEKVSLERRGRKGSGGETYNPYFIALMTAYLRAYWRHDSKARPSISLLLMDEAFKVLNSEAVRDCVQIIRELGLQGVITCTDTNGGQIVEFFQWVMIVQKRVTPRGGEEHDQIENTIYAASRNDPEIVRLLDEVA